MKKLWAGRNSGLTSELADKFNSSISVDKLMYQEDIEGSIAHAKMLGKCNIITKKEENQIISGLTKIFSDIESGKLKFDKNSEDIHMFVETVLTKRIGNVGKKLHTARSRNDQVALDMKLYIRNNVKQIIELLNDNIKTICKIAKKHEKTIMPGFTHLQKAQLITFAHYTLAYGMMFKRDIERLENNLDRINVSPIGACALAGTTYKTDRRFEAKLLGFSKVSENSIDAVSDRDYMLELASNLSIIAMHLSRLAEEMVLFSSGQFNYIVIDDLWTTGSSIMPQKKNPDMAELVRGKTGNIYGTMVSLFTVLKGLPLAYNKDLQEAKENIFKALENTKDTLKITNEMLKTMKINVENMRKDAKSGFMNATDLADYLVSKGLAFRDAYKISGKIVDYCIKNDKLLEDLSIDEYNKFSKVIDIDVYKYIDIDTCVNRRTSYGGTAPKNVDIQIAFLLNKDLKK